MQTYSAADYKKKYGDQGAWASQATAQGRPSITEALTAPLVGGAKNVASYAKNVGQDIYNSASTIVSNIQKVGNTPEANPFDLKNSDFTTPEGRARIATGTKAVVHMLVQNSGETVNAVFSPITELLKPAIQASSDALANNKSFQNISNSHLGDAIAKVQQNVSDWSAKNPNKAADLNAGLNTIMALIGEKPANKIAGGGLDTAEIGLTTVAKVPSEVGSAIKTGAGDVVDTVATKAQDVLNAAKEKISPTIDRQAQLLKDVTPDYSKKLISEPGIKNADGTITPRVQEGGLIKGRTVTPKPLELEAATELAKVKDYPIDGTNLEKYQAIQPEIAARGQALTTSLKNENILRPPQQIAKVISDAVNKVPEDSLLLQKSDPVIKSYMRVAKNAIAKSDGTLAGELKVRQLLDQAYKNARGKMAFGSDRISALDDIHTAARDALNEDIIAKAKSTDVKASLKSQWDLMRASDVLRNKAEAEAGSSIGRFRQQHPITSKVGEGAVRAAGLGAGLHILP